MTVLKFRKAVPPLDGVAETGRRGVPPSVASFISDFPCDAEAQSFEAPERFAESFVCTDALDSAHGVYAWAAIMLAVECALGLFGWWIA